MFRGKHNCTGRYQAIAPNFDSFDSLHSSARLSGGCLTLQPNPISIPHASKGDALRPDVHFDIASTYTRQRKAERREVVLRSAGSSLATKKLLDRYERELATLSARFLIPSSH